NYNMSSIIEMSLISEGPQLNGSAALDDLLYRLEVEPYAALAPATNIGGGSPASELGVAQSGSLNAYIRDASTDALINASDLTFNSGRAPVDVGVADINGSPAFAVLGHNVDTHVAWVELRDAVTGNQVSDVWYPIGYAPIALAVLPDLNANGASELAVLLIKESTGRAWVYIKDASTRNTINVVWFPIGFTPLDLEYVPNVDLNPGGELAVLQTRNSDNRTWVHVKDALTGNYVKSVWFQLGYTPKDLAVIDNLDGNPGSELAVLVTDNIDGRPWVHLKDTLTGAYVRNVYFDLGFTPVRLDTVPNLDTNAGDELAVLMSRDSDGRAWVHVRDALTRAYVRNVWFQNNFKALDFAVLPDIDVLPGFELAVLGVNTNGQLQVEIKDAKTGAFINLVDFP
ncbi:MAG: hypothetical protein ACR2QT_15045, partial [Woeseiaceae bacterium]